MAAEHLETLIIENLPMYLNLGDVITPQKSVIGRASAYRNTETGATRLEIDIDPEASKLLDNLREICDLKAIGFAGIIRRPT